MMGTVMIFTHILMRRLKCFHKESLKLKHKILASKGQKLILYKNNRIFIKNFIFNIIKRIRDEKCNIRI